MNSRFKSALDKIEAEDELVSKTEVYLRDALKKNQKHKNIKFLDWRSFTMKKGIAISACTAILLTCGGGGVYAYAQTPVAYLSLDINPSVELGINTFGTVVKAEGYNDDGNTILDGLNLKGDNVTQAVNTLVSSAADNGFISEDGSTVVSLTTETDNSSTDASLIAKAEDGANEALDEKGDTAVINKDTVPLSLHDQAKALGITPGKLNLINKLQAVDPTVTVDEYKDAKVKDIMKAIQSNTDKGYDKNNTNGAVNNNAAKDSDNTTIDKTTSAGTENNSNSKNNTGTVNSNSNGNSKNNTGAVNNKNKTSIESNKQTNENAGNNAKSNESGNGSTHSNGKGNNK